MNEVNYEALENLFQWNTPNNESTHSGMAGTHEKGLDKKIFKVCLLWITYAAKVRIYIRHITPGLKLSKNKN